MKLKTVIMITAITVLISTSCFAFRCGKNNNNLASTSMSKYRIERDCGQPIEKRYINKWDNRKKHRMVQEWVYIIEEYGNEQMYVIRFDRNGIAVEEEWLGKQ